MCCLWLQKSLWVCPSCSPSRSAAGGSLPYTRNISSNEPRQCPPLPEPAVPVFICSPDNFVISVANKDSTVDLAEYFYRQLFGIVGMGITTALLCSGQGAVVEWQRACAWVAEGFCWSPEHPSYQRHHGKEAGLVGWAFCLITGPYLEVCGPAGLLPIQSHRFPQIFAVGYLSLL